jgi:hypothetical protein
MAAAVKTINEIKAELEEVRAKKKAEQKQAGKTPPEKKNWYGLIYCDSNGYASIDGIWLGKTEEIMPYLKKQKINGENINSVLAAVEDFRAEKKEGEILHKDFGGPAVSKTQSCHSNTKIEQPYISIPPQKTNRATSEDTPQNLASQHPFFKKDPELFKLLKSLTDRDIGTPTIHRELNEHGYAVPYRTVGRWVAQMRSKQLL